MPPLRGSGNPMKRVAVDRQKTPLQNARFGPIDKYQRNPPLWAFRWIFC
jgi:hypothetical protein